MKNKKKKKKKKKRRGFLRFFFIEDIRLIGPIWLISLIKKATASRDNL